MESLYAVFRGSFVVNFLTVSTEGRWTDDSKWNGNVVGRGLSCGAGRTMLGARRELDVGKRGSRTRAKRCDLDEMCVTWLLAG